MLTLLKSKLISVRDEAQGVGVWNVLRLRLIAKYNQLVTKLGVPEYWPTLRLRVAGCRTAIYLRTGTSDYEVLRQVFPGHEYAPLEGLAAHVILDCGAYVGYSALYFLNRFPEAVVIAVEPDPENARLLRRNLDAYGARVKFVRAALWNHNGSLLIRRGGFRDGRAWATQVCPRQEDNEDPDVEALDMPTLIRMIGRESIDILKVDIEGSERSVFAHGSDVWLPVVRNIAIELHDPECETTFFEALSLFDYELLRSGELTICRNISSRPGAPVEV